MTDYRELTAEQQAAVIQKVQEEVPIEKAQWIIENIKDGNNCAKCWRSYYTCVCSHDDDDDD